MYSLTSRSSTSKDDMSEEEDLWKWLLDLSRVPAEVRHRFSWERHHDLGIYAEDVMNICFYVLLVGLQ